jgi:hypothetical protein
LDFTLRFATAWCGCEFEEGKLMAKVTFKDAPGQPLGKIARSDSLAEKLEEIAAPVLEAARRDPNKAYTATLDMHRFYSGGRGGRVSIQVGAAAVIGSRVEAKRGTLQRALGSAGL